MLVIPDAVGEWWIHPVATYLPAPYPRTVVGAISGTGRVLACELDHRTGAIRRYEVAQASSDDHNVPALWVAAGRRPLLAWTNHNADAMLRLKVGGRAGELAPLVASAEWAVDIGGRASYSQIHRIAHRSTDARDIFWVFLRRDNATWVIQPLGVDQTTGAVSFHRPTPLLDASGRQAYITTADAHRADGNQTIRLAWGYNPAQPVHAVRYLEIDCVTGDVTTPLDPAFRVNLAALGEGTGIADAEVAPLLPEPEQGFSRRLFYVRPGPDIPAVAYAEWATTDPDAATYLVTEFERGGAAGRTVRLGHSGTRVGYTAAANYIAGLAFENPSRGGAAIRASTDGVTDTVARLHPAADGDGAVVLHAQPAREGRLIRPSVPLNGGPLAAIVTEIVGYDGYTGFAGNLKGIVPGDGRALDREA